MGPSRATARRGSTARGRAAAHPGAIEALRIRMPGVGPADEDRGVRAERCPDRALVDKPLSGLIRAAEEGVRGAANPQSELCSPSDERAALAYRHCERFLRVDVLPRRERSQTQGAVRRRGREVEDKLYIRIRKQLVDRLGAQVVLGCKRRRGGLVQVGAGDRLPAIEGGRVRHIACRDHAAADDADSHRPAHAASSSNRRTARSERATASMGSPSTSSSSTRSHSAPASTAAGSTRW